MRPPLPSRVVAFVVVLLALPAARAVVAAPPTPLVDPAAGAKRFEDQLGLQLYSLRDELARNVPAGLDKVKAFGIRNVELAGTYRLGAADFRAALDARGLKAVSAHFDFGRVQSDIDGVARDAKILGVEYVGGGWIPHDDKVPLDVTTLRRAIAVFNKAGEALAKQGLKFFYHVHGFEFQPYGRGTLFDVLMAETNPAFVSFQMDVFWVVHAGQDPVALLERYRPRWRLMHLKGMKDGTATGLFTGHSDVANNVPLGVGKIDYLPVLREARALGIEWYFLEDESRSWQTQIPQSLAYLASAPVRAVVAAPAMPKPADTEAHAATAARADPASVLEIVSIASKARRAIYETREHIEAPNWSPDGRFFLFNSKGRLYRLPADAGAQPQLIETGLAQRCNNDHGISPDGKLLAVSDQSAPDGKSRIYTLPITGGRPRVITPAGPSYFHGWSPDGATLYYCAERGGNFDIYRISKDGGAEQRLTSAPGLDDGPDLSPDGRFVYFNSLRTGVMQIWRMRPDGSAQEQVTHGEQNDWFPHPSPDGKWLVFLSYAGDVKGHPENKDVTLRLMSTDGRGEIQVLAKLFGGQGTINVASWSPDSREVAFVSYRPSSPH